MCRARRAELLSMRSAVLLLLATAAALPPLAAPRRGRRGKAEAATGAATGGSSGGGGRRVLSDVPRVELDPAFLSLAEVQTLLGLVDREACAHHH